MKKYLTISNIITAAIFAAVLYLQAPTWFANSDVENIDLSKIKVIEFKSHNELSVDKSQNYIFFFWASWCGPCKVEMDRYKSSILAGKIPEKNFWAINPFESSADVKKFLEKNKFPFTFVDDQGAISKILKIRATPTTTFIEDGKVLRQSTGISIVGIYRAEWLFD